VVHQVFAEEPVGGVAPYALTFLTRQWRRVIFGDADPDSRSLRVCLA
jgi:hypothetical protein